MKKVLSCLVATAVLMSVGVICSAENLFCQMCGKSIPSDSIFCQYCGTKVLSGSTDTAGDIIVSEKSHYITVGLDGGYDIWICNTDSNLIKGDPTLEFYGPSYLNNDEISLYLFQCCIPDDFFDLNIMENAQDAGAILCDWFYDKLGGENRAFSCTCDDEGYILILHSDGILTPERYPFYGTVFCSSCYEGLELYWVGPFSSVSEAMEKMGDDFSAKYPVETEDGGFHCLGVSYWKEEEWLKRQKSPFNLSYDKNMEITGFSNIPRGQVTIDTDNWDEYFDIVEDVEDTSLILDGVGIYSCNLYTRLRLKDKYASVIDASHDNSVEFTVQYNECMGLFSFNYDEDTGVITVTDPDGFSAVKSAETADYIYRYPEEKSVSDIPVQSIMSSSPSDNSIGFANRRIEVVSASGVIWFK